MRITSLRLAGFRNLSAQTITFSPSANWIYGANGQGKSNLLEAIHYACVAKSQRAVRDRDVIAFPAETASVTAFGTRNNGPLEATVSLSRRGEKKIQLNGKAVRKASSFLGTLNVVSFSPDDVQMTRGNPATRRRFLDMLLAQTHPVYLENLLQYRYHLIQRNSLLRRKRSADPLLLQTYTDKLVELGCEIIAERYRAVADLSELSASLFAEIAGHFGPLVLRYEPSGTWHKDSDLRAELTRSFSEAAGREQVMGTTLVGPHRDDLGICVNDVMLRRYGSQGQCRAAALAIKLGSVDLIRAVSGSHPILLLDDVFSELDESLSSRLEAKLQGESQVFVAAPRLDSGHAEALRIRMENGLAEQM